MSLTFIWPNFQVGPRAYTVMARKKCVDTWNRQVAYLMKQYLALMTGGRDPRLSDAHLDNDHANYFGKFCT